jgi:hypothetical protein
MNKYVKTFEFFNEDKIKEGFLSKAVTTAAITASTLGAYNADALDKIKSKMHTNSSGFSSDTMINKTTTVKAAVSKFINGAMLAMDSPKKMMSDDNDSFRKMMMDDENDSSSYNFQERTKTYFIGGGYAIIFRYNDIKINTYYYHIISINIINDNTELLITCDNADTNVINNPKFSIGNKYWFCKMEPSVINVFMEKFKKYLQENDNNKITFWKR